MPTEYVIKSEWPNERESHLKVHGYIPADSREEAEEKAIELYGPGKYLVKTHAEWKEWGTGLAALALPSPEYFLNKTDWIPKPTPAHWFPAYRNCVYYCDVRAYSIEEAQKHAVATYGAEVEVRATRDEVNVDAKAAA